MGIRVGWFAVKGTHDAALGPGLEAAAAARKLLPSSWAFGPAGQGWEMVHPGGEYADPEWPAAISRQLACVVVHVFALEGSWEWKLFDGGNLVAGMNTYDRDTPELVGDLDRAAKLLGVRRELFARYAVTAAPAKNHRAYPGDEFPPWDEWAFLDFAKKLGIEPRERGDLEATAFEDARGAKLSRARKSRKLTRTPSAGSVVIHAEVGPCWVVSCEERVVLLHVGGEGSGVVRYANVDELLAPLSKDAAKTLLARLAKEPTTLMPRRDRVKRLSAPLPIDDLVDVLREVRVARSRGEVGSMEDSYACAAREKLAAELSLALGEDAESAKARIHPLC